MKKKYIELNTNVRKYIPIKLGDSKFTAELIQDGVYKLNEAIPFGTGTLDISFQVLNNGTIVSPIANNYFDTLDSCSSMLQYGDFKKDLFLRIKLDMEQKKINMENEEDLKR